MTLTRVNFISRLQKMHNTENALQRRQKAVSVAFIKNAIQYNKLESMLMTQEPHSEVKRLKELEEQSMQLRNQIKLEEAAIEQIKREGEKVDQEYQLSTEEFFSEQQNITECGEKLHLLQHLGNIYIDEKMLPDQIQGVASCARENEINLITFKCSANEHDKKTISECLWNLTQYTEMYNQEWENLICGEESIGESCG